MQLSQITQARYLTHLIPDPAAEKKTVTASHLEQCPSIRVPSHLEQCTSASVYHLSCGGQPHICCCLQISCKLVPIMQSRKEVGEGRRHLVADDDGMRQLVQGGFPALLPVIDLLTPVERSDVW